MNLSIKPISKKDNPFYPLPPDYADLSREGQRLARVNGCRQWLLPGTRQERGDRMVASVYLFDSYYLQPDYEEEFDPLFYDVPPLTTPEIHWEMIRLWQTERMSITVAPRGSAKSTNGRRDTCCRLVTAPGYSIVYATSSYDNAKSTGQIIREQCYMNERIQDDFGPETREGSLRPARGMKPTGVEFFYLNNGSWLRSVSVRSKLRGLRPRRFRLDDPEYDPEASTSMDLIREAMDRLLFKVALPMVMRSQCGIDWTATFVSQRHYAWHAMSTVEKGDGTKVALDPRFNHWARLLIRACHEDANGRIISCWPEMWPADEEEKKRLNIPEAVTLEQIRENLGTANFNAEYQARPGRAEDQFFAFDNDPRGKHAYWFESQDDLLLTHPRESQTQICWVRTGETIRRTMEDFLRESRLFMTVDTAYTEKASSDRRVFCLMAITDHNELFTLDMWSDRKKDAILVDKALRSAELWRCPSIHPEVVKDSFKLFKRFQEVVATKTHRELGLTFAPQVRAIKPGTITKVAKIESLDIRFEHGLIKFPLFRRFSAEQPWWDRLFSQIDGFNPEAPDGGLAKDDEIDTVAMSGFVIKGRLGKPEPKIARGIRNRPEKIDVYKAIQEGKMVLPDGTPLQLGLPIEALPQDILSAIIHNAAPTSAIPGSSTRV